MMFGWISGIIPYLAYKEATMNSHRENRILFKLGLALCVGMAIGLGSCVLRMVGGE